jgi:N-acetylneuraminic acid mutarotase
MLAKPDERNFAMRHLLSLPILGLVAALSACGHSDSTSTTAVVPLTYSIGGTVAGLSGTLVLLNNGADNLSLSNNSPFAFSVSLQPNAAYAVTIATQPANQVCSVTNGSGTATAAVTSVEVVCSLSSTATDIWTWVTGSSSVNAASVYGTQGAASNGTPGARREPISWTDTAGNFWLFGGNGVGNVGMLSDLWEYLPTTDQWIWQGGSQTVGAPAAYGSVGTPAAGNNPGAREGAAQWTDTAGNLWMFGGDSLAAQNWQVLNDLWQYSPSTGLWTWIAGPNTSNNAGSYGTVGIAAAGNLPPARTEAMTWKDSAGIFWMFGGAQLNPNGTDLAVFNDLWNYNPGTGLWTWVGGSNPTSATNPASVFGTQGEATGGVPGARMGGNIWLDASGNVWLFGGVGINQNGATQEYNDLWEYNPTSGQWTWISGSSSPNAPGLYGALHAGAVGNTPGARVSAVSWKDTAGRFYLFGGYGYAQAGTIGNLNDLWQFDPGTGTWTWIEGASSTAAVATYGSQGVPAANNTPGARQGAAAWADSSGNFWLFGGFGFNSSGVQDDLNDLWRFQAP